MWKEHEILWRNELLGCLIFELVSPEHVNQVNRILAKILEAVCCDKSCVDRFAQVQECEEEFKFQSGQQLNTQQFKI